MVVAIHHLVYVEGHHFTESTAKEAERRANAVLQAYHHWLGPKAKGPSE